jgi:hypothetical protein
MSFVFSCKAKEEASSLTSLKHIIDKITWSLRAHKHKHMGTLIWKHCEKNETQICNYMMGFLHSEEASQEKIIVSVDATFKNGYSLKLSTHLNQFMVDYDIICVLKE